MGKIILIASGKGGTGKTTAAANISAAISAADKLTLVVDMDIGLRNLDIAFGLESAVVYDICDVIEERCTLDEALIKDGRHDNLYILSAPQTRGASDFERGSFRHYGRDLKTALTIASSTRPPERTEALSTRLKGWIRRLS